MKGWVEREVKYADNKSIDDLIAEARKNEALELLNWAMKVSSSGATPGMIRKILYNKYVEISGEGEKA